LGGARYVPADSIPQRVDAALAETVSGRSLVYLYVPELDSIGHKNGWQSDRWTGALELLDGELARLDRAAASDVGIVV
ncbi:alkaline phosphatase family protein, partial [Bacillus sp. S34]|nr:alkaline phosphatase family protein [Bacillus sp. S34]